MGYSISQQENWDTHHPTDQDHCDKYIHCVTHTDRDSVLLLLENIKSSLDSTYDENETFPSGLKYLWDDLKFLDETVYSIF